MKLHLPKLLLTAVLAAVGITQTTWAETYNLLESSNGWTFNNTTYNAETDSVSASNWGGGKTATYSVSTSRAYYTVGADNTLTFSLTYVLSGGGTSDNVNDNVDCNSVQTFAFVDGDKAIVLGTDAFKEGDVQLNAIGYGISSATGATAYGASSGFTEVDMTYFDGAQRVSGTSQTAYTMDGVISYNAASETYQMTVTLTQGENTYTSSVVDLGKTIDISKFIFGSEGYNRSLVNLTIDGQLAYNSYLTTVSSEINAADATWLYQGAAAEYETISMTDGSAYIGLKGSGENSAIVFKDGTYLACVDVLSGTVELKNAGSLTLGEINIIGSAKTIVDKDTTISYTGSNLGFLSQTTGGGTIALLDDVTYNVDLSSSFAGTIEVAAGKKLYLGKNQNRVYNLANATLQLNEGSRFEMQGKNSQLGKLNAKGSSTVWFEDGDTDISLLTVGQVNIAKDKKLTVQNNWEGIFTIQSLKAEGELYIDLNGRMSTVIQSISNSAAITNKQDGHTLSLGVDGSSVLNLGGDITNSGTLNIKGNLAGSSTINGGSINLKAGASVSGNITFTSAVNLETTLSNTGTLAFAGLNVNLDNVTYELTSDDTTTGLQSIDKLYTFITGSGTMTNSGELSFTLNGAAVSGTTSSDGKSISVVGSSCRYNIAAGDTAAATTALQSASEDGVVVSSVNVLGTMSGTSDTAWTDTGVQLTGNGTVQVTGHLEHRKSNFAGFTGNVLVDGAAGGKIHLGTGTTAIGNATIVLTGATESVTAGYITGWLEDEANDTFKQNIVLKGGAIRAENNSRWQNVTVDNATGATNTVSYYQVAGKNTGLTGGSLNLDGGTLKLQGNQTMHLGGVVKFDGGVLDINNVTIADTTKIEHLQVVRDSTGEIKNGTVYVNTLDMRGGANSGYFGGTLKLTNANIVQSGDLWSHNENTQVLLEGNSSLTQGGAKISSSTEAGQASIVVGADLQQVNYINSDGVTISNATVTANNANMTISAKLKDSSVTNASDGALTVADMTVTDASAKQSALTGDMTVTKLTLASGLSEDTAAVTTSGVLTLGNITLDLTNYEAGSYTLVSATGNGSINWNEEWTRTGTLTDGLTANVGMVNNVLQLTISPPEEEITSVNASVTGVVGYNADTDMLTLQLDQKVTSGTMVSLTLITDETILAAIQSELDKAGADDMFRITVQYDDTHKVVAESFDQVVFYNEKGQGYWGEMVDLGGNVGTKLAYKLDRIPEPTTTTLSLLALSALAMRRRRK